MRALGDALAGHGRLVVIGGEPGIGKSRLAEELATAATKSRAGVLWGRCWEAGGAPPYWPWAQAIRSHIREIDIERLRRELGADAAEIAGVVAEVRERIHDLGPSPTIELPLTARFRLFDALTGFLKRVARKQPLVSCSTTCTGPTKGHCACSSSSRASSPTRACCWSAPTATWSSHAGTRSPRRWPN